jgi:hypothetical protein
LFANNSSARKSKSRQLFAPALFHR